MKNVVKAALASLVINIICAIINLVSYFIFGNIPLGITSIGGEYTGRIGFGMLRNKTWAFTETGSAAAGNVWLSFEPISIIVTLVIFFVIIWAILAIVSKCKNKSGGKA